MVKKLMLIGVAVCLVAFWLFFPREHSVSPALKSSPSVTLGDIEEDFTCWEYQLKIGSYVSVSRMKADGNGDAPITHMFLDPEKTSSASLKIWIGRRPNKNSPWTLHIGIARQDRDGTSWWPGSGLIDGLKQDAALKIAQNANILLSRSLGNGVEQMIITMPEILGENKQLRIVISEAKEAVKNSVTIDPGYSFFEWEY